MDPNYFKDQFGTEGKSVLLTFGLLSPNKGIENVIRALPAILARHPNVVYIVSGVTHPHIRRREGERYREELQALAEQLGVSSQVIFNNRFVSAEELVEHVGAADIYITPYRQEAQVVSGTLAIALGAGKAIISTPYWHAKELLAEKRGVIVPFDRSRTQLRRRDSIAGERCGTPCHAEARLSSLAWNDVAKDGAGLYGELSACALRAHVCGQEPPSRTIRVSKTRGSPAGTEYGSSADHDRRHGHVAARNLLRAQYARGLYDRRQRTRARWCPLFWMRCMQYDAQRSIPDLSHRYLAFLWLAFRFRYRTVQKFSRLRPQMAGGRGLGRQPWPGAVGFGNRAWPFAEMRDCAERQEDSLRPPCPRPSRSAVRAHGHSAFSACRPIWTGSQATGPSRAFAIRSPIACWTFTNAVALRTWHWFEKSLFLLECEVAAGAHPGRMAERQQEDDRRWNRVAEVACCRAASRRCRDICAHRIQTDSFEGGEKARFDQQPVEACATVSACLEVYRLTDENQWLEEARRVFRWFLGKNDLQVPLYDADDGRMQGWTSS